MAAPDRRRLLPLAAAVNLTAVAVTVALMVLLTPPPGGAAPADPLALAARLSLWPAAVLFAMIGGVIVARALARALNPLDDPESRLQRVAQRVLSNTVEQTLVFLPALWALVVLLPPDRLGMAGVFTGLFVAGRLLFWVGYHIHPFARAPGMAMTMTVNLVTVARAAWLAVG
ncbi:MAPEG family protein [Azospirillum halopraeferens]|uniref:MAPEG family protein n=1 Tax=Azospirillum halopraeferens TaxID=34010 RepID=UPI00041B334E|nr:MAPEG family protein [Azospirillum halopraeferens]